MAKKAKCREPRHAQPAAGNRDVSQSTGTCGLSVYLSLYTDSIIFYHHLRCGGWLNLEFSNRENIQDGPLKLFTRSRSEAC